MSEDFRTHRVKTLRRLGRRYADEAAGGVGETAECWLGQSKFLATDEGIVIRDQQGGQHRSRSVCEFDAAEAAEHFRAQGTGVPRDHGNILAAGVEVDPPDFQFGAGLLFGLHPGSSL